LAQAGEKGEEGKGGEMNLRAEITFWCCIIAFWIFFGLNEFHKGHWTNVCFAIFWFMFGWRRIIAAWDESRR
jgi:hypothetical protein